MKFFSICIILVNMIFCSLEAQEAGKKDFIFLEMLKEGSEKPEHAFVKNQKKEPSHVLYEGKDVKVLNHSVFLGYSGHLSGKVKENGEILLTGTLVHTEEAGIRLEESGDLTVYSESDTTYIDILYKTEGSPIRIGDWFISAQVMSQSEADKKIKQSMTRYLLKKRSEEITKQDVDEF